MKKYLGHIPTKLISLLTVAILCFCLLVGCSRNNEDVQEKLTVYSFCGDAEQFSIVNGIMVISADEEIFYGGDLKVTDDECFADITSYSVKFYTMTNGETRTIMHNSVVDQTGSTINIASNLGKMSGDNIIIGSKVENANELANNLYFELNTTDLNGEQDIYQVQLTITEITDVK